MHWNGKIYDRLGIENELFDEDRELLAALHAIKDGKLRKAAIEQVRLLGRV